MDQEELERERETKENGKEKREKKTKESGYLGYRYVDALVPLRVSRTCFIVVCIKHACGHSVYEGNM